MVTINVEIHVARLINLLKQFLVPGKIYQINREIFINVNFFNFDNYYRFMKFIFTGQKNGSKILVKNEMLPDICVNQCEPPK